MPQSYVNPLSGRPRTREYCGPNGELQFEIRARELTPLRARIADGVKALFDGVATVYGVVWVVTEPITVELLTQLGILWLTLRTVAWVAKQLLKKRTRIRMVPGAISVRRWYGWRHHDRNIEHRFALQFHDRAQEEQQQHDFETREESARGQIIRKIAYYGESFHVVLVHAGHRIDLLTVYGRQESTAIVARLQYCDRRLNEAVNMGGGINQHPEDEWDDSPGGLGDV